MNEHGEILHQTPLKEVFNLSLYIQHLMDENEDESKNPLSEENWMKQTNWKFTMYVIHHKHSMTPEQLKQKPFKEIFKIQHEKLDTEEGESNEEENESTTSSEKSEQDSESDTSTEDEQEYKLQITNFEVKVENQKVEGFITYSTDQQIFKFKVNSGDNL